MDIVAQILRAAAGITGNERAKGYHFPRGTMATLKNTLAQFEDGRARDGRVKYNDGAVEALLLALANCITPPAR